MSVPVKQGTDTVHGEVRNSQQGTTNILLLTQTPFLLHGERNQVIRLRKKTLATGNRINPNCKHLHCYWKNVPLKQKGQSLGVHFLLSSKITSCCCNRLTQCLHLLRLSKQSAWLFEIYCPLFSSAPNNIILLNEWYSTIQLSFIYTPPHPKLSHLRALYIIRVKNLMYYMEKANDLEWRVFVHVSQEAACLKRHELMRMISMNVSDVISCLFPGNRELFMGVLETKTALI